MDLCINMSKGAYIRDIIQKASRCETSGNRTELLGLLLEGIEYDPENYELFYMLGFYYYYENIDKAYLCMEHAGRLCRKKLDALLPDDEKAIEFRKDFEDILNSSAKLQDNCAISVKNVSIVVLSYNDLELMKQCLESVKQYDTGFFDENKLEIIVVDNASSDGTEKWLEQETRTNKKIKLIKNENNEGFAKGCNAGINCCNFDNDILLLNNDAKLTPNSLFWLRMGLYESRSVGACGAVSNNAALQMAFEEDEKGSADGETSWYRHSHTNNQVASPYEHRCRLTAFAELIKREAVDTTMTDGKLFDERFSPAYFEDDDLGMRITRAGFEQLLCHNCFVYHKGGAVSMQERTEDNAADENAFDRNTNALSCSHQKFISKWGFDIWNYSAPSKELSIAVCSIISNPNERFALLEINCGMGINLSNLRYLRPNGFYSGTERRSDVSGMGRFMGKIYTGRFEDVELPYTAEFFDIAVIGDSIKYAGDEEKYLDKIFFYINKKGNLLINEDFLDKCRACGQKRGFEGKYFVLE